MYGFLKRHGFVYKKPKGVPGKHPDEETQKAVAEDLTSIIFELGRKVMEILEKEVTLILLRR